MKNMNMQGGRKKLGSEEEEEEDVWVKKQMLQ